MPSAISASAHPNYRDIADQRYLLALSGAFGALVTVFQRLTLKLSSLRRRQLSGTTQRGPNHEPPCTESRSSADCSELTEAFSSSNRSTVVTEGGHDFFKLTFYRET